MMVNCSRCFLYRSIRIINFVVNFIGVAMIIYSLWLLKKWKQGVNELISPSSIPTPWFIYTCLGVGIAVCLSTVLGHSTANCINNSTLALYIVSICSLLLIQAVIIVAVFFRINWQLRISRYIDEDHKQFKRFVLFHVVMCRLISISVLIAQLIVAVLAGILWAVGCEPNFHRGSPDPPDFTHSFLDTSSSGDGPGLPESLLKFHTGESYKKSFCPVQDPKVDSNI